MKHISAHCVLFDLDGTLYNSTDYSDHFEEELSKLVSEELGLDEPQARLLLERKRKTIGTLTRTIESLGISRIDFYRKMASRIEPRRYLSPDATIRETLEALRAMGFQIGLVSNSGRELVAKILDAIGLENDLFDTIVTSTEAEPKPSPQPFVLAMQKLRCGKSETVYVGDREEAEIRPARELGLKTVLLAPTRTATSQWADAVITRISQLPGLLVNSAERAAD